MNVPLHLLTQNETRMWNTGVQGQRTGTRAHEQILRALCAKLCNQYPEGVGVLVWDGSLVAYVQPGGKARLLSPPYQRFERYQISNKPEPSECACREFYDPEIQGPWKERGKNEHHPICMFEQHAQAVFEANSQAHKNGVARPDLLIRVQEECRGVRGNKTGPRIG